MMRIPVAAVLALALSTLSFAQAPPRQEWAVPIGERRVVVSETGERDTARVVAENGALRLEINPSRGGRIESLIHKRSKREITMPPTETSAGGLFADQVWQQSYWHGDWNRSAYAVQILERGPVAARVQLTGVGRLWEGITIRKTFTLRSDESAVHVDYRLSADSKVQKRAKPDFWFHCALAGKGTTFFPAPEGIRTRPIANEELSTAFDPQRGWIGYVADSGTGVSAAMDFGRLRHLRSQHRPTSSIEWVLRKTAMRPGTRIETPATLGVFTGIQNLVAADGNAAVGLTAGDNAESARLTLSAFRDQKAAVNLQIVRLPDGHATQVLRKTIDVALDTTVVLDTPLKLPGNGTYVLRGEVRSGDKAPLRFECPIVRGKPSGTYAMTPEFGRTPEEQDSPTWARYRALDLNFNSMAVETPHRVWAKPYGWGRPKVLVLLAARNVRQATELAQRFDIDVTTTFIHDDTYFTLGDAVRTLRQEQLVEHNLKVIDGKYDVILCSAQAWGVLDARGRQRVEDQVKAGTGLVFTAGAGGPPNLRSQFPLQFSGRSVTRNHFVPMPTKNQALRALPYAAIPRASVTGESVLKNLYDDPFKAPPEALLAVGNQPLVGTCVIGKGRVVQAAWGGRAFLPEPYGDTPPFDYWEYYYAMLGRLLYWAARKEGPLAIHDIRCARERVNVEMTTPRPGKVTVSVKIRDKLGNVLHEANAAAQVLPNQDNVITFDVPTQHRTSAHIADVFVSIKRGVICWGAGAFPAPTARIGSLAPDKAAYDPDADARIAATIAGIIPTNATLRVELRDGSGRLVHVAEMPASEKATVALPLNRVKGAFYEVTAFLLTPSGTIDVARCEGCVRVPREYDRMQTFYWGGRNDFPSYMILPWLRQLRNTGVSANYGDNAPQITGRLFDRLGMPYTVPMTGMSYDKGVSKEESLQDPNAAGSPLGNPEAVKAKFEGCKERGEEHRNRNVLLYTCADENDGPSANMGFGKYCREDFRNWLKTTQFKTLDALNAEWKTDFATWDDVIAMTTEEGQAHGDKTGSYGPWSDHRAYLKWAYARMAHACTEGQLAGDPRGIAGPSGTREPAIYGGRDWWLLARAYTGISAYGGVQTNQHLSFNPSMVRYTWAGYSKPNPRMHRQIWGVFGQAFRGFGVFAANTYIDPDYTLPECGRDFVACMPDVNRGPAQMLVSAEMTNDGVYLLQAPASICGAHMKGHAALHRTTQSGVLQLLPDIGIGFRSVSYEQLAEGYLGQVDAKALVLPNQVAMSAAECEAVARWVQGGGILIADLLPATMTEHCRVLPKGQLDDLFGIDRSRAELKQGEWRVRPRDSKAGASYPVGTVEVGITGSATPIWTATGESGEAPVLFHRQIGKGHAVYMAFDGLAACVGASRTAHDPTVNAGLMLFQDTILAFLAKAGVTPAFDVRHLDTKTHTPGARLPHMAKHTKYSGDIRYLVIARDYTAAGPEPQDLPAIAVFRTPGMIYDVLASTLLGYGNRLNIAVSNNTVRVLALLPYRVDALALKAQSEARAGDDVVLDAAVETNGAPPGLHWFRVDVTQPDGTPSNVYTSTVRAEAGRARVRIPFALNDPAGAWHVRVTDAATGTAAATTVHLKGAD